MYTECPKTEAPGMNLIPGTFQGNVGRVKILKKHCYKKHLTVETVLLELLPNTYLLRLFVRVSFLWILCK